MTVPGQINYIDYLNATLPARQADLANRKAQLQAQLQAIAQQNAINYSSPRVSGQSSSIPTSSVNPGSVKNFKLSGKKFMPTSGRVSQNWGRSRIRYAAGRHTGMDFGVRAGTAVRSAANGVVVYAGRGGAYGNVVRVRHPDGVTTLYAHLSSIGVRAGQRVSGGSLIARSGNTGRSTGAHLHFEVRTRDRYGGDVNPYSWLGR